MALDDDTKVFHDPFALPLSGAGGHVSSYDHARAVQARFIARLGCEVGPQVFRYLRALMVMRSRYAALKTQRGVAMPLISPSLKTFKTQVKPESPSGRCSARRIYR
jgi:hypothetical protein